ncbi:type II toxin-antitoxin system RelE/ParE family toxin [Alicyclobacillus sacchari]|uniref:type II toxin-antitoxin system RelE/ParE family toxin n=1 Tax=Alicyclobacillus sacchari TaxID=392010 RepID=UPI00106515DC
MTWSTQFYRRENGDSPVEEYLDSLPVKHRAKVLRSFALLKEFGPGIGDPHVENIVENIRCLRVKQGSDIFRVFFFTWVDRKLILLHGFSKKTQKTPPKEIERALRYRDDFLRQQKKAEKGRDNDE